MSSFEQAFPRPDPRAVEEARTLLEGFAERTGLVSDRTPQRYLWTDAFAVCSWLALERATGQRRYRELALALVEQVHAVLGRHRPDDPRDGWLSGLPEEKGAQHPTRGGLRIGKPLPERPPDAPFDERLEWERDGQYFHYLTRWMHALDQTARATGEARYNAWARELADVAYRTFTRASRGGRGMVWKLSIDLSRPLVPSMGQHDPVDGLVTCLQLQASAARLGAAGSPFLDDAVAGFDRLAQEQSLATADPLGLGGLLVDACRVLQLIGEGAPVAARLPEALLGAAHVGLAHYAGTDELARPAERRLAFRELGLAIGLAAVEPLRRETREMQRARDLPEVGALVEALAPHAELGARIAAYWRDPARRANRSWAEHADIDEVMLAACCVPEGVLVLREPGGSAA